MQSEVCESRLAEATSTLAHKSDAGESRLDEATSARAHKSDSVGCRLFEAEVALQAPVESGEAAGQQRPAMVQQEEELHLN